MKIVEGSVTKKIGTMDLSILQPVPRSTKMTIQQKQSNSQVSVRTSVLPTVNINHEPEEEDEKEGQVAALPNLRGELAQHIYDDLIHATSDWGVMIRNALVMEIQPKETEVRKKFQDATLNARAQEMDLINTNTRNNIDMAKRMNENSVALATTENEQRKQRLEIDGQEARAKISIDVAQSEAAAMTARTGAQLLLLNNPCYLRIQLADRMLEMSKNLASAPVPATVMYNAGGGGGENNGMAGMGGSMMIGNLLAQLSNLQQDNPIVKRVPMIHDDEVKEQQQQQQH